MLFRSRSAAKQVVFLARLFSIVLVHGAGSFGHIPAKRWDLASGFRKPSQLRGLSITKSKLLEWEAIIGDEFLRERVPLFQLSTSDFVVTNRGRIRSADMGPIRKWLSIGCIPSLGGDLVTDVKRGFAILSGDQLAAHLAIKLAASRLIFGIDVDGIFDANPKLSTRAKLLGSISTGQASGLIKMAGISFTPDVTGGMAGKISEAVVAARRGIPVYFVNLTKGNRLESVALNRKVPCSRIKAE